MRLDGKVMFKRVGRVAAVVVAAVVVMVEVKVEDGTNPNFAALAVKAKQLGGRLSHALERCEWPTVWRLKKEWSVLDERLQRARWRVDSDGGVNEGGGSEMEVGDDLVWVLAPGGDSCGGLSRWLRRHSGEAGA